jgi:hypothetical protein
MHKQDKLKNFSILYSKLGCCRELPNQKEERKKPFSSQLLEIYVVFEIYSNQES